MARLAATTQTLRRLFALSGNQCAFPGCDHPLINKQGKFIAELCHIEGVKGERYNPAQSDEQRRAAENLVLLCHRHHVETDEVIEYTVDALKQIKANHEKKYLKTRYELPEQFAEQILDELNEKLEELLTIAKRSESKLDSIISRLDEMNAPFFKPTLNEDLIYIEQLKSISGLKQQRKHQTVIDLLLNFKQKNWAKISPETKFRVIANLAFTYFDMLDKKAGAETILQLKHIPFESEESLSLMTIAYSVLEQKEEFLLCFEKIKEYNAENANAWISYIYIFGTNPDFDENEIPPSLLEKSEILFNLGDTFFDLGQKEKGIEYFYRALALQVGSDEKVSDTKSIIAYRLMVDLVSPFKYIHRHYTKKEKENLTEVIRLLGESWELVKNTELEKPRFYVLMNRGVAYKLNGQLLEALSDFERAYELSQGDLLTAKNLVMIYLQVENYFQADSVLLRLSQKDNLTDEARIDISIMRARSLFLQNKTEEAIKELERNLERTSSPDKQSILVILATNLLERNEFARAQRYTQLLINEFPKNILGFLFATAVANGLHKSEEVTENLDSALLLVNEKTSPGEIYELASLLVAADRFSEGAGLFKQIANENISNSLSRGLIYAYYQQGNIPEALSAAQKLYKIAPHDAFVAEILMSILIEVADFDRAIVTGEQILENISDHLKDPFLLRTGHAYFAKKDYENAIKLLRQIQHPQQFSMDAAFLYAKLLVDSHDYKNGLRAAYDIRNRFYDECPAHDLYLGLSVLIPENEKELAPETVGVEAVVHTENDAHQETTFLISNSRPPDPVTILAPRDNLAKQMIGKSVGEKLAISNQFEHRQYLTIKRIQNLYAYAFDQSRILIETRFSGQSTFMVIHSGENPVEDLTNVLRQMAQRSLDAERKIIDFYNTGQMPIGVMSGLHRINSVEQWCNLVNSSEMSIFSYSHDERAAVQESVASKRPLVLDLTALLTLFLVYPEHHLFNGIENKIIIAQSTLDELHSFSDSLNAFGEDGRLGLGFENGSLVRFKTGKEDLKRFGQGIDAIIQWCKQHAEIATPITLNTLTRDERQKTSDTLKAPFFHTLLLAQERQAAVVSDDDIYKQLVIFQHQIGSFSSYQWAAFKRNTKEITDDFFIKLSLNLILANHIFIPPLGNSLWECFDMAGYQIRNPFTTAAKGLRIMHPFLAVDRVVAFVKQLYLNTGLSLTREQTILFVLTELAKHSQFDQIKRIMPIRISTEFRLLHSQGADFMQMLGNF